MLSFKHAICQWTATLDYFPSKGCQATDSIAMVTFADNMVRGHSTYTKH